MNYTTRAKTRATNCIKYFHPKGPCGDNELFVLKNKTISQIPECIKNVCAPGKVLFGKRCVILNRENGCIQFKKLIGRKVVVAFNSKSFRLTCITEDSSYECKRQCCDKTTKPQRKICRKTKLAKKP